MAYQYTNIFKKWLALPVSWLRIHDGLIESISWLLDARIKKYKWEYGGVPKMYQK